MTDNYNDKVKSKVRQGYLIDRDLRLHFMLTKHDAAPQGLAEVLNRHPLNKVRHSRKTIIA